MEWIDKEDFRQVDDLPLGFEISEKLKGYVKNHLTEWIPSIIGSAKITELEVAILTEIVDQEQQSYIDLIKQVLVYAAWSDWNRFGHIQNTQSGPATFSGGEGALISREDRAELVTYYYKKANRVAGKLAALWAKNQKVNSCRSSARVGQRPSVVVMQGKNKGERF